MTSVYKPPASTCASSRSCVNGSGYFKPANHSNAYFSAEGGGLLEAVNLNNQSIFCSIDFQNKTENEKVK